MTNNILFFLLPKSKVAYVEADSTLRQVMEKLDYHGYTAIPILTKDGHYYGTITEGDILREIKRDDFNSLVEAEKVMLKDIERKHDCVPIHSTETMENLLMTAVDQNFVPVLDDNDVFIGIITRKSIIVSALNDLNMNKNNKEMWYE